MGKVVKAGFPALARKLATLYNFNHSYVGTKSSILAKHRVCIHFTALKDIFIVSQKLSRKHFDLNFIKLDRYLISKGNY